MLLEITKLLLPLGGLVVTAAIALGAQYLRERSRSEVFSRAILSVESVVKATVLEAQQTIVDGLKEAGAGKLTDSEKAQVKSNVLEAVKDRLIKETVKELQGVTADLEGYLSGLIESHVYSNKVGKP